jgi:hypothetical protein
MVKYECFRCGYIASQRINLRHHLNRKNICEATEDDIDIEEIKKYYGFESSTRTLQITPKSLQITPNPLQNTPIQSLQNHSESLQIHSNFTPNNSKKLHCNNNQRTCEYCLKTYSRKDNLTKHLKTCKKKKESEMLAITQNEKIIKMEKESENMKKEIEKLKNFNIQTQNNITTNNNNINNSKNIIINNYGNEDLKHLRSKDFANLLNGIYSAVPKLIEKIHFDPEHPENQNIKYTNQKSPYMKVIKDSKWQFVSKKEELLDLIDNKCFMLKENYYALLEKKKYNITCNQRNKIEEFIEKYHEDDKKIILDLIERTELMLLNNS